MANITDINQFYADVGEKIKYFRTKLGYSQDDIGKFLDLTRSSIVNVEKGRQRPLVHTLYEIASYLKVSVEDLLPSKDEKEQIDFTKVVDDNVSKYQDISIDKEKMVHFFQISASK